MRLMALLSTIALLSGCGMDYGCLHGRLDDWCMHSEQEGGPVGRGDCQDPVFEPLGPDSYRCGDIDVMGSGPNFSGADYYFDHRSGKLVAVERWTDVNHYCGGFSYWYGRRVLNCDRDCTYGEPDGDVPMCDSETSAN